MNRHLLPDEFDLLVDADSGVEAGFGVAPLRAHVRECANCRAELEQEEALAAALGTMPHFAPPAGFADRVMAEVEVFEPWHVALADTARRVTRQLVPASAPLRVLAAGGALAMAALLTTLMVWVLARADVLAFTTDAAAAGVRDALWGSLQDLAATLAGAPASSGGAVALALAMFAAAIAVAATGLRAAAAASRRARPVGEE